MAPVNATCGCAPFPQPALVVLAPEYKGMGQALSVSEAIQLEEVTRAQSASNLWFKEREGRITASNFGSVIKRKKEINEAFLKKIFPEHIAGKAKGQACEYGKKTEINAKHAYIKHLTTEGINVHLHDCGLVVNPEFPFLGASPDGKVCKNGGSGIIEIKCPFIARDIGIHDAVTKFRSKSDFCLRSVNDVISLKRNHNYYYQVQGQLMITGASFCDFIVYTPLNIHVETIYPDVSVMQAMLHKLAFVYKYRQLPLVC